MLTVTDRGYVTQGGKTSHWFAVYSPTNIKFRRRDAEANAIGWDAVYGLSVIVPEDVYNDIEVGDYVYLGTEDGAYDAVIPVTYKEYQATPDAYVVYFANQIWAYDDMLTGFAVTTWVNVISRDYVVEIELQRNDLTALEIVQHLNGGGWNGEFAGLGENFGKTALTNFRFKYATPPNGELSVNIAELVAGFIDLQYLYGSPVAVNRGANSSKQPNKLSVYMKYRQNWSTAVTPLNDFVYEGTSDFTFLFINAARQPDTIYGSNLFEYVCSKPGTPGHGKWLTTFEEPIYYIGLPFHLSTLVDDTVDSVADDFVLVISEYDVNGTLLTTTPSAPFKLSPRELKHFSLPGYYTDPHEDVSYITVGLNLYLDEFSSTTMMLPQKIRVQNYCSNDKAIIWKNPLGGESIYCFPYNQDLQQDNEEGTQRMTVYAENLTLNEWEVLQEITNGGEVLTEPFVSLLDDYGQPIKGRKKRAGGFYTYLYDENFNNNLRAIVVDKSSNDTRTRNNRHSVLFSFQFKERYYQK
jgi:hypothetical protein